MDPKTRKLRMPAALAVVVLAGCGGTPAPQNDAATPDAAVADARDFDAGCVAPEEYDPVTMTCVPLI